MPEYISASQAAKLAGLSHVRIRQLAQQHRIKGARKLMGQWRIPTPVQIIPKPTGRPRTRTD